MKFNFHNGSKIETIYTPDELQKIIKTNISYYANQAKELRTELNKTKEEMREEVRKEFESKNEYLKSQLRFSIATLNSEKELQNFKDFIHNHRERCKSFTWPIIAQRGTTFGVCTEIQCPVCKEKEDITDISIW